jgi:hypothetical protein
MTVAASVSPLCAGSSSRHTISSSVSSIGNLLAMYQSTVPSEMTGVKHCQHFGLPSLRRSAGDGSVPTDSGHLYYCQNPWCSDCYFLSLQLHGLVQSLVERSAAAPESTLLHFSVSHSVDECMDGSHFMKSTGSRRGPGAPTVRQLPQTLVTCRSAGFWLSVAPCRPLPAGGRHNGPSESQRCPRYGWHTV